MINEERVLKEFFEFIQIPCSSLNEREIADILIKRLTDLGFSIEEDDAGKKLGGNTGNIVATRKGNVSSAPMIMLTAHMDCVEPCANIKPQMKDGLITSDGTTILGGDDKAGVVAILEALRVIEEKQLPCGDLQVVFTICEEKGVQGSKNMDSSLLKAKHGFTFDTSGSPGRIVRKAPGQNKLKLVVTGKAAHAGNAPEKGINSIIAAGKILAKFPQGRVDDETTCNIGTITGGSATNVVAETTTVMLETRSRVKSKLEALTNDVVRIFEEGGKETGTQVEVTVMPAYDPFDLPEDCETIQIASKAAAALNFPVSVVESGGGSDASFFNAYGVPTTVLGVGMTNVHTKNECILEKDLYDSARLALQIIQEVAK